MKIRKWSGKLGINYTEISPLRQPLNLKKTQFVTLPTLYISYTFCPITSQIVMIATHIISVMPLHYCNIMFELLSEKENYENCDSSSEASSLNKISIFLLYIYILQTFPRFKDQTIVIQLQVFNFVHTYFYFVLTLLEYLIFNIIHVVGPTIKIAFSPLKVLN